MIGMTGGRQGISIGSGCEKRGIVEHEIGHALGLWHEQSRPDADNYITVQPANIIKSMISNFLQRFVLILRRLQRVFYLSSWNDVTSFKNPYDLGSIMHYGPTAFTNDWTKYTIVTKDKDYQRTIGQREKLSFYDYKTINNAYCKG